MNEVTNILLGRAPVKCEGIGLCFIDYLGKRPPRRGEWYLSGALPFAYRAPNNLPVSYLVVHPAFHAVPMTGYIHGVPVVASDAKPYAIGEL